MRKFLIYLLFRYYFHSKYNKPIGEIKQDEMLTKIANTNGLELFPIYLEQCIINARNKYLYTNDPVFKGSIMAYTFLLEQINKRKSPKLKKELTQEEKVGIMRGRGY